MKKKWKEKVTSADKVHHHYCYLLQYWWAVDWYLMQSVMCLLKCAQIHDTFTIKRDMKYKTVISYQPDHDQVGGKKQKLSQTLTPS